MLPALKDTLLLPDQPEEVVLELDELWSFVTKATNAGYGWRCVKGQGKWSPVSWVGEVRLLVSSFGKLSLTATGRASLYSDFWKAYRAVLPDAQHQAIGKGSSLPAHSERFDNTLRQRLARLVRKTLSFSKSDHMHLICLHRLLIRYNLEIIRD